MRSISDYSATIGTPAIASALPAPAASSQDLADRPAAKAAEHSAESGGAVFNPYSTELRVAPVAQAADALYADPGAWMLSLLLTLVGVAAVVRLMKKYLG